MLEKFIQICAISDILIIKYSRYAYVRILPIFHIVREHPTNLKKYKNVFIHNKINIYILILKSFLIYLLRSSIKLIKSKKNYSFYKKNNIYNYDNIFISHLVSNNQLDSLDDFYFSEMPNISSQMKKTLLVLINHTSANSVKNIKTLKDRKYDLIILSNNLPFIQKIKILCESFNCFFVILKDIFLTSNQQHKILMWNSLHTVFNEETQLTFRIYLQVKDIINKFNPKKVFFTCEGYSWEKSVSIAAKNFSKNIKCIGYQHSRIFKFQHSLNRDLKNNMNPDIILTSGKVSHEKLKKNLPNTKIIEVGKKLKQIDTTDIVKCEYFNEKTKIIISVLPEEMIDECIKLLKFSYTTALKYSNIYFIWRFHPLTNLTKLNKNFISKLKIPKNIMISNHTLEEDLRKSNMALYRGSATILQAMRYGVIPIYYNIDGEFDIDIIENKLGWNIKTSSSLDMLDKIKNITKDKNDLLCAQKECISFSKKYFSNFDKFKFEKVL